MHRKLTIMIFRIGNRKPEPGNRFTGFTITEVITASALMVIAIVPILKGLSTAHFHSEIIERKTCSLALAQAKLDEIKARSVYYYTDTFSDSDLSIDGSYLCDIADASAGSNLRTITVSVGYDLNDDNVLAANEVLVTLSTLIARRW